MSIENKCDKPACGFPANATCAMVCPVCHKRGTNPTPATAAETHGREVEVVASSRPPEYGTLQPYREEIARLNKHIDALTEAYMDAKSAQSFIRIPAEPTPTQGKEAAKQGEVEILREFVKAWDAQIVMAGIWMVDCACQSRLIPKMQEAREVLRRKESPCSNESQGSSPSSPSCSASDSLPASSSHGCQTSLASSNPPAWATPQILAACRPGDRLWYDRSEDCVSRFPDGSYWASHGFEKLNGLDEEEYRRDGDEMYTVPAQPSRCDGSAWIQSDPNPTKHGPCLGCPACKPEPNDGVRPLADWSKAKMTPIYKPARPDLDKDAEIERLKADNAELEALFDLRWKRDMEALALWRGTDPSRQLTMPDHGDLVIFLLGLFVAKDARICSLEAFVSSIDTSIASWVLDETSTKRTIEDIRTARHLLSHLGTPHA